MLEGTPRQSYVHHLGWPSVQHDDLEETPPSATLAIGRVVLGHQPNTTRCWRGPQAVLWTIWGDPVSSPGHSAPCNHPEPFSAGASNVGLAIPHEPPCATQRHPVLEGASRHCIIWGDLVFNPGHNSGHNSPCETSPSTTWH